MEDWPFSSFNEYYTGIGNVCNRDAMKSAFGFSGEKFYEASYFVVPEDLVKKLF